MRFFNIILATDKNGGIGYKNELPWKFEMDSLFYKKNTEINLNYIGLEHDIKNILIMGRKTFEGIPKKRNVLSFIISSKDEKNKEEEGIFYFKHFYDAYLECYKYKNSNIWVIGGSSIYDTAIKHWGCQSIYWTEIEGEFKVDTYFKVKNYNIKWETELKKEDINKKDGKPYILYFRRGMIGKNIETQYLELLENTLFHGEKRMTRNGYTLSQFSKKLSWNLEDGFPILTTKKMFWKGIVEELLFFIRGDTNTKKLNEKGIHIWDKNTSKDFLKLNHLDYQEGEMGPMYGYQWRRFNGEHGMDQLSNIIQTIKKEPTSRRLLITDFNPLQVHLGVLYPCHSIVIQFYIEKNRLHCNTYQRSGDLFLGIPFNISSSSLFLSIISHLTDLKVGSVNLILGDYHIYDSHIDSVKEQLKRTPYSLPTLVMKDFKSLKEVEESTYEDYSLENYVSHPSIKIDMIA